MSAAILECGCVPLPGGGVARKCAEGMFLWVRYLGAMERDPVNLTGYAKEWAAYCAHIGQEAWA